MSLGLDQDPASGAHVPSTGTERRGCRAKTSLSLSLFLSVSFFPLSELKKINKLNDFPADHATNLHLCLSITLQCILLKQLLLSTVSTIQITIKHVYETMLLTRQIEK